MSQNPTVTEAHLDAALAAILDRGDKPSKDEIIVRLRLEIERLRAALSHIENHELRDHEDYEAIQQIASDALRGNQQSEERK